jgi:oligoendopeptidase F
VVFEGKEIPVSEAGVLIPTLDTSRRRALHRDLMRVFQGVSDFSESELNAVVTNKKISDKLRGFRTPYESTVKTYENDLKTVKDLVSEVTKNFHIAHRFFKIKSEMLGEARLSYADRAARVGEALVRMPFEQAVDKVIRSFREAHREFGDHIEEMFINGEVDVFPKKGKSSGAFCSSSSTLPTFVLLNHVDDFRSLTTLAHEMGHALHSKYAQKQRPIYEDYTISVAEVASTFFENLVFESAMEEVGEKERMVLLHDKINDDISTIFRQIACFNFEAKLHETIRKEGFLPKEKIAEMMNNHMKSYLGPRFDLEASDGYFFVNWSHIRSFFYVYSYAFGQLVSDALYEMYREDKGNIKKVIKFMEAGGSESPENIFRSVGINPDKRFFEKGLKKIQKNVALLERLWIENGPDPKFLTPILYNYQQ